MDLNYVVRGYTIEGDRNTGSITVTETPDRKHVRITINGQAILLRKEKWEAFYDTRWNVTVEEYDLPELIELSETKPNVS